MERMDKEGPLPSKRKLVDTDKDEKKLKIGLRMKKKRKDLLKNLRRRRKNLKLQVLLRGVGYFIVNFSDCRVES